MPKKICLITGIGGLIGSECANYFKDKFDHIMGIDCNARAEFFGESASVQDNLISLGLNGTWIYTSDISNKNDIDYLFRYITSNNIYEIDLIIHTAAQPSHDYATEHVHRDFEVNALGTLNLLEAYRKYCPNATFIFTSTNKVYGECMNKYFDDMSLKFSHRTKELESRYDYYWHINGEWTEMQGVGEYVDIDRTTHSLFGCSKTSADLYVQEYGRYFGLKTGVFRGGCLTGPAHKGVEQHGFLSYLCKCIKYGIPYTIYGFKGKQVRDIIHSFDVATIFEAFYNNPRPGEVYNIGGGRHSNCSILEAIEIIERKLDKKIILNPYVDTPRKGDHIWYITDMMKFKNHYPDWNYKYNLEQIIDDILVSL